LSTRSDASASEVADAKSAANGGDASEPASACVAPAVRHVAARVGHARVARAAVELGDEAAPVRRGADGRREDHSLLRSDQHRIA